MISSIEPLRLKEAGEFLHNNVKIIQYLPYKTNKKNIQNDGNLNKKNKKNEN